MANEIMLIQTAASLGQAAGSMLTAAQSCRDGRRQERVIFEEKMKFLKAQLKAKGLEELFRFSMEQIQHTYDDIMQGKYSGEMLQVAMEMLHFQIQCLKKNIEAYSRS